MFMSYQTQLPNLWETERLSIAISTVEEVPVLQAIHDACSYLSKWDGSYIYGDPDYLNTLVTNPPLPPQGGERERFKILTIRERGTSTIIGFFAVYEGEPPPDSLYIFTFFVHPDYQGKGYGRETMGSFLNFARETTFNKLTLCTALKNFPAVRFWTGLGVNKIIKVHGDKVCSENTHAQIDLQMEL
ncbi:hypothetical protein GCM10025859_34800 [Alicyclobacillus fastidiosus]|nr:hypothetical protein GCM10025859_34800 [Alicyclobacillus fastidiosus]